MDTDSNASHAAGRTGLRARIWTFVRIMNVRLRFILLMVVGTMWILFDQWSRMM